MTTYNYDNNLKIGQLIELVNPMTPENKGIRARVTQEPSPLSTHHRAVIEDLAKSNYFSVGEEMMVYPDRWIKVYESKEIEFKDLKVGQRIRAYIEDKDRDFTRISEGVVAIIEGSDIHTKEFEYLLADSDTTRIELLEDVKPLTSVDYPLATQVRSSRGFTYVKYSETRWIRVGEKHIFSNEEIDNLKGESEVLLPNEQ